MLRAIAFNFDWTMDCSASFVIGQSNYFGVGFTTLNLKLLSDFGFMTLSQNFMVVICFILFL